MSLNVKEITTEDFGHCALLTYEDTEIIVTLDYGPRIVSVKRGNEPDLIYSEKDPQYQRNHGHKMRITIEKSTNAVYCDDYPVRYSPMSDGVSFIQTLNDPVQLELSMDVVFNTDIGDFMVVHSVYNKSKEDVKLSIYTETPFDRKGFVFIPQSNIRENERPSRVLSLWDNCRWDDKRLFIGEQYVTVHSNISEMEESGEFRLIGGDFGKDRIKIGVNNTAGFCGYIENGYALIKRYVHNRNALYPFTSCSAFATVNDNYLSIQNTSPFYLIGPGESARHIESWIFAHYGNEIHYDNETELDSFINTI